MSPLRIAFTAVYLCAWPALLLLLAGDARWPAGWLFSVWFVGLCVTVTVWLYRKDPELLAERYRPGAAGQRGWDRVWVGGIALDFLAWMVLMPLDARRFHWSPPFALGWQLVGAACLLGSAFFLFRAFHDNTFLSPMVRIQRERKQRVVSTGVYGFVRHPMYLGALLMFVGGPLLLGSLVGLALAALTALLLAARILGEERMLVGELEGYDAYRQKVRYRLVPFVW
jgi:protein-S-isoprenylcysteine O-methyltransferase Ste14